MIAAGGIVGVARGDLRVQWAIPSSLMMLVAFIFLIPALLPPFTRTIAWLLRGSLATMGLLASRQAEQRTTRLGLTIGVLVVALCNGIGLGHAILNNVDDVRAGIGEPCRRLFSSEVGRLDTRRGIAARKRVDARDSRDTGHFTGRDPPLSPGNGRRGARHVRDSRFLSVGRIALANAAG